MGRDAAGRAQEAHWKLIFEGSKYTDRLPIGTEAIIRNVDASVIKAFYKRWYRPQNMAVVAVGDFADLDKVVDTIRCHLDDTTATFFEPDLPVSADQPPAAPAPVTDQSCI